MAVYSLAVGGTLAYMTAQVADCPATHGTSRTFAGTRSRGSSHLCLCLCEVLFGGPKGVTNRALSIAPLNLWKEFKDGGAGGGAGRLQVFKISTHRKINPGQKTPTLDF